MKFFSSVRVEIRRTTSLKDGDQVIGNRTRVKIVKNKVAAPFREAEVDILYGKGISRAGDLLDLGVTEEVIEKSGSWYSYGGERIGQGRDNARTHLEEHPELCLRLESELRRELGIPETSGTPGVVQAAQSA